MSLFNEAIKSIKIRYVALVFVICYLILFILGKFDCIINQKWIYVFVIFYFLFKLKDSYVDFKYDVKNVFSKIHFRDILFLVILNILFSYGMLYLTNEFMNYFPSLNFLLDFYMPVKSLNISLPVVGSFISTVFVSAICEELVFRGVLLSRLRLFVPQVFAILASSLLFGALHNVGAMFSAFIFAVCMAILYIKTDNICVPIFAHFLNNLIAEIIRLVDVNNVLFTNNVVMCIVGIASVFSFAILIKSIIRELTIKPTKFK